MRRAMEPGHFIPAQIRARLSTYERAGHLLASSRTPLSVTVMHPEFHRRTFALAPSPSKLLGQPEPERPLDVDSPHRP